MPKKIGGKYLAVEADEAPVAGCKGAPVTVLAVRQEGHTALQRCRKFDKAALAQAGLMEALAAELALIKPLRHVNILDFVDVVQSKSSVCIVEEYALQSIREQRRKVGPGGFTSQTLHLILAETALGLRYLHAQGFAHRHISPDSVLLCPDGVVKISDFRAATRFSAAVRPAPIDPQHGLPINYLAPEWAFPSVGESYADPRAADSWGIGVLCYFLATGTGPFDHGVGSLESRVRDAVYARKQCIETHVLEIVASTLQKNATERIDVDDVLAMKHVKRAMRRLPFEELDMLEMGMVDCELSLRAGESPTYSSCSSVHASPQGHRTPKKMLSMSLRERLEAAAPR